MESSEEKEKNMFAGIAEELKEAAEVTMAWEKQRNTFEQFPITMVEQRLFYTLSKMYVTMRDILAELRFLNQKTH